MPVPKALSPAHRGDDQLPQATHLADNISAVQLQRLAARLHELGLRSKYELLRELAPGADHLIRLEVYARLDADMGACARRRCASNRLSVRHRRV